MKHISLTSVQRELLDTLAGGGMIAVVHTRGGTIASLFPQEGRHRNISFKMVQPMLDAGWIEDVVPKPMRWRGSKFVISARGLKVARAETSPHEEIDRLDPRHSEVGSS
ncbi:MAG TPA: hypothetical protein VNJ52_04670 [Patescibacteria group bacterium]|nr:hypothetical protein [Patescibacteria group bacterium]